MVISFGLLLVISPLLFLKFIFSVKCSTFRLLHSISYYYVELSNDDYCSRLINIYLNTWMINKFIKEKRLGFSHFRTITTTGECLHWARWFPTSSHLLGAARGGNIEMWPSGIVIAILEFKWTTGNSHILTGWNKRGPKREEEAIKIAIQIINIFFL
jgi:hypothetical protein